MASVVVIISNRTTKARHLLEDVELLFQTERDFNNSSISHAHIQTILVEE